MQKQSWFYLLFVSSFCFLFCFLAEGVHAQAESGDRSKVIDITSRATTIDSLSLVFGSVRVYENGRPVPSASYSIDHGSAQLIWKGDLPVKSIKLRYRVFPLLFSKETQKKDPSIIEPYSGKPQNPFTFRGNNDEENIFSPDALTKSGSISRGIIVGNNQDLSVNSNMDLQLAGKLSDDISVLASITDDNIPIQPDGNSQQLQDFDQVFIQLYNRDAKLTAGDFQIRESRRRFMQYFKRAQGANFEGRFLARENPKDSTRNHFVTAGGSAAISKGKFARNLIQGVEGNQGPYRLEGGENELFIIVLAGTERIYIDGRLLERGQNKDYIINYNTAEVTFTPRNLITKDRRIIAEFQYSDKNYARSLFQLNTGYETERASFWLHGYSEQDSKNQPLQQDLTLAERDVLASVGDSLQDALVSGARIEPFASELVLYSKKDTLGDSIFVYTTKPTGTTYRLSFSLVGQGNGNYMQDNIVANGRVFKWVAPDTVNGFLVPRGNYEPVILLVSPKRHQVFAGGGTISLNKNSKLDFEAALSNKDENTFSTLHGEDDTGHALKLAYQAKKGLGKQDSLKRWTATTSASYELVNRRFRGIERFRSVEFDRNWNVRGIGDLGSQHLANAGITFSRPKIGSIGYNAETFITDENYSGLRNHLASSIAINRFVADFNGSVLTSTGLQKTQFARHKSKIEQGLGKIAVGYIDERESNRFTELDSGLLADNSYAFYDWETYVRTVSESGQNAKVYFRQRTERRSKAQDLAQASLATHYGINFSLAKNRNSQLTGSLDYRSLEIQDNEIIDQEEENTLLSRLNYRLRLLKGAVLFNSFYEIGSGQELRREFTYIRVQPGQGVYIHIDYNENGVEELNEFEIAPTPAEGQYIKVFTPTNEYARTFTNQFNQSLNLKPGAIWRKEEGFKGFLAKFSNQSSYRIDRKTNTVDLATAYNPFISDIADTSLLSLSGTIRNTIYFNRSHPKFGMDHTFQNLSSKTLLTNGFDSRARSFHTVNIRWNLTKTLLLRNEAELGNKRSESDFLTNRAFNIDYYELSPEFSYQPGTTFRLSLLGSYREKFNSDSLGGQQATIRDLGTEVRYNIQTKGSLLANFNFIVIDYDDDENTALAYEMLEALRTGNNITWNLSYQRNLSKNMQLNLNYSGRKSQEINAVHTGGIQVRAFF